MNDTTPIERPTTGSLHEQLQNGADGDAFLTALDHAFGSVENQTLIPQSRCVDHLLDLLNATHNPVLRAVVTAALESIRRVNVVLGDDMHASLSVIGAAANVELCLSAA